MIFNRIAILFLSFSLLFIVEAAGIQRQIYENYFKILSSDYDHDKIEICRILESQKHSYIVFIKDLENNEYIIKQDKSTSLLKQFYVVFETLASYIAIAAGVSSQRVELLPIGFCFPGKLMYDKPATIHTLVPGKTIRELRPGPYGRFLSIKQNNDPAKGRIGLNRRIIASMAMHPDLPLIAAFDTFVGNRDRNTANILYDAAGNRFYAIDMGVMYDAKNGNSSLAKLAGDSVKSFITQKEIFGYKERNALKQYYKLLKHLFYLFPPDRTYALLERFVRRSGLKEKYALTDPYFREIMKIHKKKIKKTYIDIQRLIFLLSNLLGAKA